MPNCQGGGGGGGGFGGGFGAANMMGRGAMQGAFGGGAAPAPAQTSTNNYGFPTGRTHGPQDWQG
jgi:hypothetical protein